tara:strand:+ start:985 stop:1473 length:489 start_codon:yes stop_codon:yes gene_type:complete
MLLDINKSRFGSSAVGYSFEYFDSLDSDVTVESYAKGTRTEMATLDHDFKNEFGLDGGIYFTFSQSKRTNRGMLDDVQYITFTTMDQDHNEAFFNFKVLRSPSHTKNFGFNNYLLFNDLVFKTPNELFAYILEEYFGLEISLENMETVRHSKKELKIVGIKL